MGINIRESTPKGRKENAAYLGGNPLLLGFEKQVATVAMSLVEAVVQRQGVANHTIHLHTVVKNASKRALCVSLGHTQLSVVLGSEHRVGRLLDVCSG